MQNLIFDILRYPDAVFAETDEGWEALSHDGNGRWTGRHFSLTADISLNEVTLTLEAGDTPVKFLKLCWNAFITERLRILNDHWERAYGDLEWRGVVPERVLPWYFLVNNDKATDGYGVKTGPNSFCYWQVNGEGVVLTADVRCGEQGVRLGQRPLTVAVIVAASSRDNETPFSFARHFCSTMCEQPVLPPYPVYGGNNWYYAYGNSSHEKILEDSKFISSLAVSQNRPFMVIDDGWQLTSGGGISNGGPWIGNSRFPDMPGLASQMADIGVRPGIWCRPLLAAQSVSSKWVRYRNNQGMVLDPSHPEVLSYVENSIAQMVSWGYELIKHDFSTVDILGKWGSDMRSRPNGSSHAFQDSSKTTAEIVKNFYRTIQHAAGSNLVIGCNTVSHLAAGIHQIQRTGDDTSGRSWERTRYMGVNTLAFRMPQHNTFYAHDADCAGITEHIPWGLNRQWLNLLAASGTPLFVSADPAVVTCEQRIGIEKAFDLASGQLPVAEPLDWLSNTCPNRWLLNGVETDFKWNSLTEELLSGNDIHWWN